MNDLFQFDPLRLADEAIEGNRKMPETYAILYGLQQRTQEALRLLKEGGAVEEIKAYGKEGFAFGDTAFRWIDGKRTYNYDHIPHITAAENLVKRLKEDAKAAAIAQEKGNGVFTEDGVVVTPAIIERSADTIVASPIKQLKQQ